jgi:hypothetical protein
LLIVYADSIGVNSGASIRSNGANGGAGIEGGAAGGGSGGGSISLFYSNSYSNSGTVAATGGATGGVSHCNGGTGGAGTVRNVSFNPSSAPAASLSSVYDVTEASAKINVTITDDFGLCPCTVKVEWGNSVNPYPYSASQSGASEGGTYTLTMDRLDQLTYPDTFYTVSVTNSEGNSTRIAGQYTAPKSLFTVISGLSGSGDTTAITAYADIPVEYIEVPGNTIYTENTSLGSGTPDERMLVVKYKGDLIIANNSTIAPAERKRGMVLYVEGALYVNGSISMTARGAKSVPGQRVLVVTSNGTAYEIPASGAGGGSSGCSGSVGGTGSNGATGGGGGAYGGVGASGTSYSGGSAAGAKPGSPGSAYGGPGGSGDASSYGGGAGNPGGVGRPGGNGTGGLLIVYADSILVNSGGSIRANGANGGAGSSGGAGGGGSGGGSINLFYSNSYLNSGTVAATGGSGGSGSCVGRAGGAGTVRNVSVNPNSAPAASLSQVYETNETSAKVNVTIGEDFGLCPCTVKVEWGNAGNVYEFSETQYGASEGDTLSFTMGDLMELEYPSAYFVASVTNSEGESTRIAGEFNIPKTLLTQILALNNTGDGSKTIYTSYATLPVEYIQFDGDVEYSSNPVFGDDTADASTLVAVYNGDLTIDAGVTLTPQVRKRGMVIYVTGALTVNGMLSMTARGAANVVGNRIFVANADGTAYEIPASGAGGGSSGCSGSVGGTGSNGATGGGGGAYGGVGASGTSYSGGSAAGAKPGSPGSAYGGPGGSGDASSYGGGAGNPGGVGRPGGNGTGGLLIVYADSILVNSGGSIRANGANGGAGSSGGAGGGGSGGGSINLFYSNSYLNSGTVAATAGSGGGGGCAGRAGGAGTVRSVQYSPLG